MIVSAQKDGQGRNVMWVSWSCSRFTLFHEKQSFLLNVIWGYVSQIILSEVFRDQLYSEEVAYDQDKVVTRDHTKRSANIILTRTSPLWLHLTFISQSCWTAVNYLLRLKVDQHVDQLFVGLIDTEIFHAWFTLTIISLDCVAGINCNVVAVGVFRNLYPLTGQ